MDGNTIIQFLSEWGYWILLPLMALEGPVVTIIAAFMASLGIFHIGVVLLFAIVGDVIGDVLFYAIGRTWGMRFVRYAGKYIGITESLVAKMKGFFKNHGGKTIFLVKSTTGLCWATFTAAGIVRMHFGKFVGYSLMGGIIWSGFLVTLGYFFGYLYGKIALYISWAGWIIFALAILILVVIALYRKKQADNIVVEQA